VKVVFLSGGAREKALRYLIQKNVSIEAVITPLLSSKNERFKQIILTAIENGIKVMPVDRDNLTRTLNEIKYDVLISCGFPYIIDQNAIDSAKYAINVHPTLLPAYRGYRSGPYIIINGEKQTGVTIHFLTTEMDQGDIIVQKSFDITPFDTTKSLFRKCQEIEQELIYSVLEQIRTGQIHAYPQDESRVSIFSYIRKPDDSFIDWNKSLKELYNEIRACDPTDYPAHFFVDGEKVCIKLWRPDKPETEFDMI
jgi:methionyl-tRNA formyltransferase